MLAFGLGLPIRTVSSKDLLLLLCFIFITIIIISVIITIILLHGYYHYHYFEAATGSDCPRFGGSNATYVI